ncbi:hypothetical protein [Nonomuraea sp. NPDC048826]|uniref:hypothetical protein n=1 Tax=Nonomuraea sp. NPDC048826 TaxID=3364347 RepID=UPI003712641F
MARLEAQAVVEAIPRDWLEAYVRALLDQAEELTLDDEGWIQGDEDLADVTLVAGDHLTAGARYQRHTDPAQDEGGNGTTTELVITSWDRTSEVSAAVTTWHADDEKTAWTVKLSGPDALRSVTTGGAHHAAGRLHRWSWAAKLDCRQWWDQVAGGRRQTPATVLIRHHYGQAKLRISPAAEGGKWRLGLTVVVRGRGWVRPFAAVGLLFVRRKLEVKFREMVAEMADGWNKDVPGLLALDPREAGLWMPELSGDREEYARWAEENG